MKTDDILGIGKILPIHKLIDIVSSVTGRVTKHYFDRKDIDTKAYEIKKLAEARAEEVKIIADAIKDNFTKTGDIKYKEDKFMISSPKELTIENKQIILIPCCRAICIAWLAKLYSFALLAEVPLA